MVRHQLLERRPIVSRPVATHRQLIIGGVCRDSIVHANSPSISGKQPVQQCYSGPGGGAHNFALAASRLNPNKEYLVAANIGQDANGELLQRQFESYPGVAFLLPAQLTVPTSESIIISRAGQIRPEILSIEGARGRPLPMADVRPLFDVVDSVVIHAHRSNAEVRESLNLAMAHGARAFIVPSRVQICSPLEQIEHIFVSGCDTLICNHHEAAILTGREAIHDQLDQIHLRCRAKFAFITCEANGIYASDGASRIHVPAYFDIHRKVIDSTGAGDAATAAIVECMLRGFRMDVAALAGVRNGFEACLGYGLTVKNTCDWRIIEDHLQVQSKTADKQ